jgi:hypothetical protein
MNFGGTFVAPPKAGDLKVLGDLLELLRHPEKAREAVSELAEAANRNEKVLVVVREERQELERARAEHGKVLGRERAEHDAQLTREREQWKAEQAKRLAEIEIWEKRTGELLTKTERDSKAAAALKRDLEQKLARLHELAA